MKEDEKILLQTLIGSNPKVVCIIAACLLHQSYDFEDALDIIHNAQDKIEKNK